MRRSPLALRSILAWLCAAVGCLDAAVAQPVFQKLPRESWIVAIGPAIADIDGDGDPDVVGGGVNRVYVWINDGLGTFKEESVRRFPGLPRKVLITPAAPSILLDVDGDGDVDWILGLSELVSRGKPPADIMRLYLNDGRGRFTESTPLPLKTVSGHVPRVADVDGDGDPDLVLGTAYWARGQTRVLINDGKGRFRDETGQRMPQDGEDTIEVLAEDFDGDGDVDLFLANLFGTLPSRGDPDRFYRNDGKGRFVDDTSRALPSLNTYARAAVAGDVDADGDLDVIVGCEPGAPGSGGTSTNVLLLNDGNGVFRDATRGRLPPSGPADWTGALALADFDEDGDLDLFHGVWKPDLPDRLLLNDGKGRFTEAPPSLFPRIRQRTIWAIPLDFDGDGDVDLLAHLHNTTRHLYAPKAPVFDVLSYRLRYTLQGYGRPGSLYFFALGTKTARVPLPPLGTLGLDPSAPFVVAPRTLPPSGIGTWKIDVPGNPSMWGIRIHAQGLVVGQRGQTRTVRLTNRFSDVVR